MLRTALLLAALLGGATSARADEAADLAAFAKAGGACDPARAHCFGIQLHVAQGAGGGFVVTPAWMADQIAMAQKHFAALDASWEIVGASAIAAASAAHVKSRKDRDAFAPAAAAGKLVHVFLTARLDDIDNLGDEIRGVTWRAAGRKYIVVSGIAPSRTLAHELGHFFGLPHSTYAISIMNKTPRDEPPPEQRTFAAEEITAMKPVMAQLVRDKVLADRKPPPAK